MYASFVRREDCRNIVCRLLYALHIWQRIYQNDIKKEMEFHLLYKGKTYTGFCELETRGRISPRLSLFQYLFDIDLQRRRRRQGFQFRTGNPAIARRCRGIRHLTFHSLHLPDDVRKYMLSPLPYGMRTNYKTCLLYTSRCV